MRTLSLPLYSRRTLTVRTQRGRDPDELTAPCLNMLYRSTISRAGNVEATWEEEKPISRGRVRQVGDSYNELRKAPGWEKEVEYPGLKTTIWKGTYLGS